MKQINCDGNGVSEDKNALLQQCETAIERGLQSFLEAGKALLTIRDERLYRLAGYRSFENYCLEKWKITRAHATNLIFAFKLEKELSTAVDKPVLENEHQARKFRKMPPAIKVKATEALKRGEKMPDALYAAVSQAEAQKDYATEVEELVAKIWRILDRKGRGTIHQVLQPFVKWSREYEEQAKNLKLIAFDDGPQHSKDDAIMLNLQNQFRPAA